MFQKNRTMPLLLEKYQEKTVQEREKNRNPETTQKVTNEELLHQLKKVDAQIGEGQRESEDCEDALYYKSLVPIMKALPLKKKRLAKIKISQLLFDLEFNE